MTNLSKEVTKEFMKNMNYTSQDDFEGIRIKKLKEIERNKYRYTKLISFKEIVPTLGICEIVERDIIKGYRTTKFFKNDGTIIYERIKKANGVLS